jgi:hypothetical protein
METRDIEQKLLDLGLNCHVIEKGIYFLVQDIKDKAPDYKIDPTQIVKLSPMGVEELFVEVEHIKPLTPFDRKIRQSLNFNPK